MDEQEFVELASHRAMIELPEHSVEIELNCKVFEDGKIIGVSRTLGMDEIREAFRKADDGYIDDEDRFVLTEKGRQWLEEMEKN